MTKPTKISQDERYPYFEVSEKWGESVGEVPADTLARWRKTMAEFEKVQDEMQELFNAAEERNRKTAEVAKAEKAVRDAQARLDALRDA